MRGSAESPFGISAPQQPGVAPFAPKQHQARLGSAGLRMFGNSWRIDKRERYPSSLPYEPNAWKMASKMSFGELPLTR
jgi:hypothetical protein